MTSTKDNSRPAAVDPTRRKRLKVVSACGECRRKKTKCDGSHPCAGCTKARVVCEYSHSHKARHNLDPHQYHRTSATPSTTTIGAIENRLNVIEDVLFALLRSDGPRQQHSADLYHPRPLHAIHVQNGPLARESKRQQPILPPLHHHRAQPPLSVSSSSSSSSSSLSSSSSSSSSTSPKLSAIRTLLNDDDVYPGKAAVLLPAPCGYHPTETPSRTI
ncbi:hypothetical protein EC973_003611 [Apophysomyces ossiformis]|uniref:Zn(2)-C6 fungal-type domain-containing protein n=1 Tax=Apophysomyces ossiformis TaxID=679940 RepID=A0A8H7ETI2_9FUNG|nr:hypothetical protein EC973_003611 [Apophysomyces ossiformis]